MLKTGVAYAPLNPNHPKSRLLFMIDESGVRMIISDSKSKSSFNESTILIGDVKQDNSIVQQPGNNLGIG